MALPYALKLAVRSIWYEKWINLLSILTMAAGLLFTALTVLSVYNIEVVTQKLPEKFSMMLYLKDNLSQRDAENIIQSIEKDSAVKTAKYITKDEALRELKISLKDTAYLLEGLGENPLPDSIEVKLRSDAVNIETAIRLTAELKRIKGVEEIEYGEKFLSSLYTIRVGIKTLGIIFVILMIVGMIFICYSTVKILFYRKSNEIETYKLLGATRGFIRAPFIIEGAVIGASGGFLSLVGIFLLYHFVILRLSSTISLFKAIIFPTNISLLFPLIGLVFGMTGAVIAIGRIKY